MSYLVLARKYRPMFFQDVVGQQHVTTTLQNAIQQNRVANAYLFSGPRGVGKTTVARILSKALNCQQGPSIHPCNKCSSCQEINESQSLDVFEIDGASNRGIDEVRNLRESLRYSPNPGKHRIYIIDEVHMLTNEAFNALLKTLEEPPSRVLFIFATTEVHKVPATILSRCQRFEFKRITNRQLMGQLRVLCSKENIQIDEESLRLIVSKADGSMRDSQSILDQVIAYGGKTITSTDVVSLLGIINFEFFFKMTQYIQADDVQCGLDLANTIFIEGYDYNEFLIGLQEHFRNFLVVKNTRATTDLDVSEEHAKRYLAECDAFEVEDLLRLIKIAADTENLIRRSSNARLHLEMALVKMIKLNKSVQLSDLLQQLDDKKKSLTTQHPHPKNSYQTRYPQSPRLKEEQGAQGPNDLAQAGVNVDGKALEPSVTLQQVEQQWPKIIQEVKRHKVLIGSFLDQGWPTALHGVVLEISFDKHNGFHIEAILNNANFIQQIIRDILGVHLKIKCSKDEQDVLKQLRKTPAPVDRKKDLAEFERQNPMLRIIKETFDADWVD